MKTDTEVGSSSMNDGQAWETSAHASVFVKGGGDVLVCYEE